jgi:hypothetical protein
MTPNGTPVDRWRNACDSLPWSRGHLDDSTFECFKVAVAEGIARQEAFNLAESRIRAAGRRPRGKLKRQWLGAIKWVANHGTLTDNGGELQEQTEPGVEYDRVDAIVRAGCGLYDLWEESPLRFEDGQSHTEEIIEFGRQVMPWLVPNCGSHGDTDRRVSTGGVRPGRRSPTFPQQEPVCQDAGRAPFRHWSTPDCLFL